MELLFTKLEKTAGGAGLWKIRGLILGTLIWMPVRYLWRSFLFVNLFRLHILVWQ